VTLDAFELDRTWRRFWAATQVETPDAIRLKGVLVAHYAYIVARIVLPGFAAPSHISPQDLEQEGMIALSLAVDRYDPHRGLKFDSYAADLVRGALKDFLRKDDWATRSARRREKELRQLDARLERRHGFVTNGLRAQALKMSMDEFEVYAQRGAIVEVCSLDALGTPDADNSDGDFEEDTLIATLVAEDGDPFRAVAQNEATVTLQAMLLQLPARLREILSLRMAGETYVAISSRYKARGVKLGRTRVWQLEREAHELLKAMLEEARQVDMVL
jgi:RNA polymerase sigma factor for flagellar operon FliA